MSPVTIEDELDKWDHHDRSGPFCCDAPSISFPDSRPLGLPGPHLSRPEHLIRSVR